MTNAIFCTCAEKNQKYYFSRIENWYEMLKNVPNTDFFCCVDGKIIEQIPDSIKGKIKFIELTPALGRTSCWQFEGFKRSFGYMMNYLSDYDNVTHIESDVKIINMNKFLQYQTKPGCFSSIDQKYHFIETAFLILNDKNIRNQIGQRYILNQNIEEKIMFETVLQCSYSFEFAFNSIRKEGNNNLNESNYDFIAQYCG